MFQKLCACRLLGLERWHDGVEGWFFCSGFWFLLLYLGLRIGFWSRHGPRFFVTGQPRHCGDHISRCWPGLIGIRLQEGILEQIWDGAIGCGRRACSAGDVFRLAALQRLFRQGGDGVASTSPLQHPFVGDGGLLRLLEPMQLDVTQQQRHHRPPAQDQAWVVFVRCALELIPQR